MLYLVGLGLGDAKDITVKGLEVVKRADRVYLEAYTSLLTVDKDQLVSKLNVSIRKTNGVCTINFVCSIVPFLFGTSNYWINCPTRQAVN